MIIKSLIMKNFLLLKLIKTFIGIQNQIQLMPSTETETAGLRLLLQTRKFRNACRSAPAECNASICRSVIPEQNFGWRCSVVRFSLRLWLSSSLNPPWGRLRPQLAASVTQLRRERKGRKINIKRKKKTCKKRRHRNSQYAT